MVVGISVGSGKVDELRIFVEERAPELVSGKQFFLGKLTNDGLWNLKDPEIKQLIRNLISYALIRDEYRMFVKENAASPKYRKMIRGLHCYMEERGRKYGWFISMGILNHQLF